MVYLLSGNTYLFYLTLTSCYQVFAFRMNFVDLETPSNIKKKKRCYLKKAYYGFHGGEETSVVEAK